MATIYRRGHLFGFIYDYNQGGGNRPHVHDIETRHNIIVMRGAIKMHDGVVVQAGEIYDVLDARQHNFTALCDGTRTLHLLLTPGDGGWNTYEHGQNVPD